MTCIMRLHLLVLLIWAGATASADELDKVFSKVGLPDRFTGHTPNFSVQQEAFTFQQAWGPEEEQIWVIRDGKLIVALIRRKNTVEEGIRMLGFYPSALKETWDRPKGRFHLDTEPGPILQTYMGIGIEGDYQFTGGGESLTLTREKDGQVNTFIFRFSPKTGYWIDVSLKVRTSNPESKYKVAKASAPGTYDVWEKRQRYSMTVYTPRGSTGYKGYYNNMVAISRLGNVDLRTRDPGFIAFIEDKDGWGFARTRVGGGESHRISGCNVHNVWHPYVNWPSSGDRTIRHRLVGIPPEASKWLKDNMEIMWKDDQIAQIRIGSLEDFEGQPMKMTTSVRGLSKVNGSVKLSTAEAYSGTKSMEFNKEFWPNTPQIPLDVFSTYRIEAMLKAGPGAEAYITGKTFEWSPHGTPKWYFEGETQKVKPADGWKKVHFDVTTQAWDPFIDLRFRTGSDAVAWMDDFKLVRIDSVATSLKPAQPSRFLPTQGLGAWLPGASPAIPVFGPQGKAYLPDGRRLVNQ